MDIYAFDSAPPDNVKSLIERTEKLYSKSDYNDENSSAYGTARALDRCVLYGPPGTGKTTALLSMCIHNGRFPYTVMIGDLVDPSVMDALKWALSHDKNPNAILVRDAHAVNSSHATLLLDLHRLGSAETALLGVATAPPTDKDALLDVFGTAIDFTQVPVQLLFASISSLTGTAHSREVLEAYKDPLITMLEGQTFPAVRRAVNNAIKTTYDSLRGWKIDDYGSGGEDGGRVVTLKREDGKAFGGTGDRWMGLSLLPELKILALLQGLAHCDLYDTSCFDELRE